MTNIDPKDARQGRQGRPVLYVLIAGLALAIVAFIGMGFFGASQPDENIGGVEPAGVETGAPPPDSTDSTLVSPSEAPPAPPASPAPPAPAN